VSVEVSARGENPGATSAAPPFDAARLDELLMEAGIDLVLATSPHNTRYLLGGYRFFLYDRLDPIGPSRYLPVLGYARRRAADAFYVGAGNEDWGTDVQPLWVADLANVAWGTVDAARAAAARVRALGLERARIGVEPPFLPSDAAAALAAELPGAAVVDAGLLLDELRAIKSAPERELMRQGAGAVVDAMLSTFGAIDAGITTGEACEVLRREQTRRGLTFDYCLVASGKSTNRAPSGRTIEAGDVLSLDSGADLQGYTADLTRMGIVGEPTARHDELLAAVAAVQDAATAVAVAGRRGGDLFDVAAATIAELDEPAPMSFLAHGTGLLTHEAPRLTATGSPPYPATHRDSPLEAGMVLSIETHVADPEVGFVKLEDTVIVGAGPAEVVAGRGREWNRIGG
jgi:Xaa-Pro aminopeptidase